MSDEWTSHEQPDEQPIVERWVYSVEDGWRFLPDVLGGDVTDETVYERMVSLGAGVWEIGVYDVGKDGTWPYMVGILGYDNEAHDGPPLFNEWVYARDFPSLLGLLAQVRAAFLPLSVSMASN